MEKASLIVSLVASLFMIPTFMWSSLLAGAASQKSPIYKNSQDGMDEIEAQHEDFLPLKEPNQGQPPTNERPIYASITGSADDLSFQTNLLSLSSPTEYQEPEYAAYPSSEFNALRYTAQPTRRNSLLEMNSRYFSTPWDLGRSPRNSETSKNFASSRTGDERIGPNAQAADFLSLSDHVLQSGHPSAALEKKKRTFNWRPSRLLSKRHPRGNSNSSSVEDPNMLSPPPIPQSLISRFQPQDTEQSRNQETEHFRPQQRRRSFY